MPSNRLLGTTVASLGLVASLSAFGASCANGSGVDTGGAGGSTGNVAMTTTSQGSTTSSVASTTVASTTASSSGMSSSSTGVDPCAMGCIGDTFDIDQNPLTGECGCEYECVKLGDADPI